MDSEVARRAAERQKKIIANAEARLKKITDSARLAPLGSSSATNSGFVDFEVDSYVNEPSTSQSATCNGSVSDGFSEKSDVLSPSNSEDVTNGFLSNPEETSSLNHDSNHVTQRFARGGFSFPPRSHMMPPMQAQNGGPRAMNFQDMANSFGPLPDFSGLTSSNPSDLGALLNALSSLNATAGSMPRTQPVPQEEVHPVFKPVLNMIVFLVLGVIARIFFQFSTLNINVFAPFMCLAIPLSIMSWGRGRPPATGLLSAMLLFVRSPRTQAMILNFVRLTTLIRGVCRLFACYFFTFIVTHAILELPSISTDIDKHSSQASQ